MFENPRRGRQARNFTTNAPKILDLKSSSEQIFSRKLPLGAPVDRSLLFGDWHESGGNIGIKEVNQADYTHKVHEVINNAICLRIIG